MKIASMIVVLALVAIGRPAAQTVASSLDYEFFKAQVQPILLKARAANEGIGQACVGCHSSIATRMRLQPLHEGATTWNEEESRKNFEAVSGLVIPGEPMKSPILVHPLAADAGGDAFHTGGKFWASKEHADFQTISKWVASAKPVSGAPTTLAASASLDYEFFKARIQPMFLVKREGLVRCTQCHTRTSGFRLQPLPEGATAWTEQQSRQNFEAAALFVAPGDPTSSRFLMHPLARSAGGDPFHGGGKHWNSKDDPEFKLLEAWVRGQRLSSSSR